MKSPVALTYHCIAQCQDCAFLCEDFENAHSEGVKHCEETGHDVDCNRGYLIKMHDLGFDGK